MCRAVVLSCGCGRRRGASVAVLDVDGLLLPLAGSQRRTAGRVVRRVPRHLQSVVRANPLLGRLDPEHGRWLLALSCELVWATSWMADANEVISRPLGLPEPPVLDWPERDVDGAVHWKTSGLVRWAGGRPFVWLDNETTDADRVWVAAHHPGRSLLHRLDPHCGLTHPDITVIDS
jgi:hypothetical protein